MKAMEDCSDAYFTQKKAFNDSMNDIITLTEDECGPLLSLKTSPKKNIENIWENHFPKPSLSIKKYLLIIPDIEEAILSSTAKN